LLLSSNQRKKQQSRDGFHVAHLQPSRFNAFATIRYAAVPPTVPRHPAPQRNVLVELLRGVPPPVTLVTLGPLTNLAATRTGLLPGGTVLSSDPKSSMSQVASAAQAINSVKVWISFGVNLVS